ncbi:hypothetical protein D3C85_1727630 [compost metagenome]
MQDDVGQRRAVGLRGARLRFDLQDQSKGLWNLLFEAVTQVLDQGSMQCGILAIGDHRGDRARHPPQR